MNYPDRLSAGRRGGPVAADLDYDDWGGDGPIRRLDPRAILSALRRNRTLLAGTLFLAALTGLAVILGATPRYRATASLRIDQRATRVLDTEDSQPPDSGAEADRSLQTEVDILASRSLAIRVADALHLLRGDGFFAAMGQRPPRDGTPAERRERVLALLQDHLRVTLPRNSRVVQVSFDSRDPQMAAAVANSFCTNFLFANLQRRFAASQYSRDFLQGQLAQTKARLEASERALIGYARAAGLVDASAGASGPQGPGPRSLTTANLVDLNGAYAAASAARIAAEQRWREAQAAPLMSLPEVLSNPAVAELTRHRAELQGELEQLRQRFKPEHPTMVQQQARIAALDEQARALAGGLLRSLEEQFRAAAAQEQALARRLATLKGQTLAEQDRGIRYNILKREVDTNRQLYDGLLGRFKEVSAETGITSNNVSVVDVADPPLRPVWPRPVPIMGLALLVGAALAGLLVILREWLVDAVRAPDEVGERLGLPLLGAVPRARGGVLRALDDPRSPVAEAIQSVRTALELASDEGLPRTVLVTSSREREGKTTVALALARALAEERRVLLVDADLRRPSLHRLLMLGNEAGLSSLLARRTEGAAAIQPTIYPGLDLLAAGPLAPNPGQLLAGATLPAILAEQAERYDLVILDGPPVLALADAPRLAGNVAATLFVVEANRSQGGGLRLALNRLAQAHATVTGAILTKMEARAAGYRPLYGLREGRRWQEIIRPR